MRDSLAYLAAALIAAWVSLTWYRVGAVLLVASQLSTR
jgi:hypothetical protein